MSRTFLPGRQVVLLAEDDTEMRILLSLTLRRAGWRVIECEDGAELLARLEPMVNGEEAVECDLIITDLRMPGASGMEVAEGFVQVAASPPLILITAFGDERTHEWAQQLGAAAVLDKPFEMNELVGVAHRVLEATSKPRA